MHTIYIYMYRERERYTHLHILYIYIYMYRTPRSRTKTTKQPNNQATKQQNLRMERLAEHCFGWPSVPGKLRTGKGRTVETVSLQETVLSLNTCSGILLKHRFPWTMSLFKISQRFGMLIRRRYLAGFASRAFLHTLLFWVTEFSGKAPYWELGEFVIREKQPQSEALGTANQQLVS